MRSAERQSLMEPEPLETEGFVVSEAVKFSVTFRTAKTAYEEMQTRGFEVALVAARADRLVLATVKSFFGSRGVVADHVTGEATDVSTRKAYALLNDLAVRHSVVETAADRYGFATDQVQLRLYVGRFAAPVSGDTRRSHPRLVCRATCRSRPDRGVRCPRRC